MPARPEGPDSGKNPSLPAEGPGSRLDASSPNKIVTVLSVSGSDADHLALGHLFRHTKWTLMESRSCRDAAEVLRKHPVPVIICERSLPDGDWKDVLRESSGQPHPPLLIVACRLADDCLWTDVMNCGGYDVLEKPFNQGELVRVVSLAWLAWKDQWQRAGERGINAAGE